METGSNHPVRPIFTFLGSEGFIGSLVAILSILTAVTAYQAWRQDDMSGDAEIKAIRSLTESNTEYISANQAVILDYNQYDKYIFLDEQSEEAIYLYGTFSDELITSFDRPDGPFDDQYYDDQFLIADELYEEANLFFETAEEIGELADGYQIIMLIFAVGLSLGAWASLSSTNSRSRPLFALLSLFAFGFGCYLFISIILIGSNSAV